MLPPTLVALLTAGVPLMILEFGFGHKMRTATITAFKKLNRKFEWVGWWQITVPVVAVTFYSVIISWSLRYLIFSFTQAWGKDPGTFFAGEFLGISSGPLDLGGLRWGIFAAVAVVWFLNYYISANRRRSPCSPARSGCSRCSASSSSWPYCWPASPRPSL